MQTHSPSPRPPGAPRWVAMFHDPESDTWRPGAESPYRFPVLYAVGEMTQTLRARGEAPTVAVWGPRPGVDGPGWERQEATATVSPPPPAEEAAPPAPPTDKLTERMTDRRQQVLMAGLSKAGIYDLTPADTAAVETLVDTLDETTLRRLALWLTTANGNV
ncbi:hypothetical protein ACWD4G_40790 [Streptomyces sp. NPDC002643]